MSLKPIFRFGSLIFAAFVGGIVGSALMQPQTPEAGYLGHGSQVVGTFGVGGVITDTGDLWQYRPDKKSWVTLDESFALEGQATSVVPLPIPTSNISHMETFGFIVAKTGDCYLYDIENRIWENIGTPVQ
ncbi:MAG: hypothetical protein HKN21_01795 [Candidatus Eisenbacteria bacterium]|uniref:Uncharacterized protein n=1 Tax=Eiseniibacteriota bacterium TaxID=2212470 RepID=A0A7Y2E6C2_UNCEI|nr:hypothetical protein [Candidatus Eisenbacteria bacterium]